jgi:hypothetical protein
MDAGGAAGALLVYDITSYVAVTMVRSYLLTAVKHLRISEDGLQIAGPLPLPIWSSCLLETSWIERKRGRLNLRKPQNGRRRTVGATTHSDRSTDLTCLRSFVHRSILIDWRERHHALPSFRSNYPFRYRRGYLGP